MTIASQIRHSEETFKLANNITQLLAEKFGFAPADAWAVLSPTRSVEALQKHFRRERKRNDPLAQVKKPRTAFSFFTQENRAKLQAKNPNASFGELSRLVSADWKKLSASQMKKYKDMETADKSRYQTERERVLAEAAQNASSATEETPAAEESTSTETATPAPSSSKKSRSRSSKTASASASTETAASETPAAEASETPAASSSSSSSSRKSKGKGKKARSNRSATATA
jgi:hypothetical protein